MLFPLHWGAGHLFQVQDPFLWQKPKKFCLATPNQLTLQQRLPYIFFFSVPFRSLAWRTEEYRLKNYWGQISLLFSFVAFLLPPLPKAYSFQFMLPGATCNWPLLSSPRFPVHDSWICFPSMGKVTCSQHNSLTQCYFTLHQKSLHV